MLWPSCASDWTEWASAYGNVPLDRYGCVKDESHIVAPATSTSSFSSRTTRVRSPRRDIRRKRKPAKTRASASPSSSSSTLAARAARLDANAATYPAPKRDADPDRDAAADADADDHGRDDVRTASERRDRLVCSRLADDSGRQTIEFTSQSR